MIVLKHNDTVYIAKSCWAMRDPEARRCGVPDVENLTVWHPNKRKERLVAVSTPGRFADVIRYENVFPTKMDRKHLILESYEKIYALAARCGLCDELGLPETTVFAEKDRAYVLYPNGAHVEVENICAICAENEAVMALYDLKGANDPYEFFKEAFQTIEEIRKYVMFPVTVMNTKTNKIEVIRR